MPNSKILVVGGAGYVGSHFCLYAQDMGLDVCVFDNLSKGHKAALRCSEFVKGDLNDFQTVSRHLSSCSYDAIFHFAADALVGESVANPSKYYKNNIIAAYNLLEAMRMTRHDRIIFSSSCAVYGYPEAIPIKETHPKNPVSPYGRTKLAMEWMLEDFHKAYGIKSASLRYFNAAGCEPSRGLGEDHSPESHLIPNVVKAALGLAKELVIFGNDYPTPDGTCIRDYIHVTDLAVAHVAAMNKLESIDFIQLNLGTGTGLSNREIVETVSNVSGVKLIPIYSARREGDPSELVAESSKAREILDWKPSRSGIESIVKEVIQWFSENPKGYSK
ncbi:MAG: UDP-glucose 4-epimerase GalE [Syntrophaceae bacterium]|nr:UDP-glucose 4-epimerase GalE [Syntrophaceae bacterium]